MSSRLRHRDETATREQDGTDRADADQHDVELKDVRSCRGQDINGAGIRVRMRTLHVNDALVFGSFKFRQVRVNRRRFSEVRVHVKKRRKEHREKKNRYGAAGRQSLQRVTTTDPSFEAPHNIDG